MDIERMDREYGEFKNDRINQMTKSFFFDKEGNYDPPKDHASAMEALNAMGATPAEATAILGSPMIAKAEDEIDNNDYQNWHNTITGADESALTRPPGKGWIKAGTAEGYDRDGGSGGSSRTLEQGLLLLLRGLVLTPPKP